MLKCRTLKFVTIEQLNYQHATWLLRSECSYACHTYCDEGWISVYDVTLTSFAQRLAVDLSRPVLKGSVAIWYWTLHALPTEPPRRWEQGDSLKPLNIPELIPNFALVDKVPEGIFKLENELSFTGSTGTFFIYAIRTSFICEFVCQSILVYPSSCLLNEGLSMVLCHTSMPKLFNSASTQLQQ